MEFRTTEVLRSTIFGRQAPVDTSTLVPTAPGDRFPTTSLQQGGFAILFLFPTIALLVVCLRIFSRQKMKQFGWGKYSVLDDQTRLVADWLRR